MSAHPLLRLSAAGVRHAARARHLPAAELSRRIYAYHTFPLGRASQGARQEWPELEAWLGITVSSNWSRTLANAFAAAPDPDRHWMHWRRPVSTGALQHKLYVSPTPESVREVFPLLVETFDAMEVPAFKIGASRRALLRPDKLVAYFASREHLAAVAEELAVSLGRTPVHGVPFTPPLDAAGLLSWGYDPGNGGSWRSWIAQVLAGAIARAPIGPVEQTVSHAHGVLRSAGVDPDTWAPVGGLLP